MDQRSNNRFPLKIILSYAVLFALALVSGYFIYSEIQEYITKDTTEEAHIKLLKTGALATELYEAESLSKLALQSKTKKNFQEYRAKVDSIFTQIDTLKRLSVSDYQRSLLDSVQYLLQKKMANSSELLDLKVKNDANNSIDNALKRFTEMEASLGKITAEALAPNIKDLSPKAQQVIRDIADYLNKNIPENTAEQPDSKKIDSILVASKALLDDAKKSDLKAQQFLAAKEKQINQNDLVLSQQLRTILSAFEQEIIVNSYNDAIKRQTAMRRGMRLAGGTAVLGFITVAIFTFLINRDYWRIRTYRENLEKEKKYSESLLKSREQLISTVSHDLKTPLNTITGYTELMENTPVTEKQARYLRNVKSASGYVANLVNDLLDFSKLEAGKLNIEKKPFVVADLIRETVENVSALYQKKQLDLFLEIAPQLQKNVLGDPFRIRQILTNLLSNAFKFTEEGSITLKASANETGKRLDLSIEVIDTGIGIPNDKQHLIFKEFTQADPSTEKKYGGHGLGLTISKKLAELLKGSLKLKSKVGQGSTFTLRIPLEITHEVPVTQSVPSYSAPKLRMLIIDDDAALLGMLKELAESMDIQVRTFANFLQIDEDQHLEYDLVLTDIQMPQISGFEVLEKLRSGRYAHYTDQPIVAMTGRRDLDMESYMAHGFAQVIQKPFSRGELIGTLNILGFKTDKSEEKKQDPRPKNPESNLYDLEIVRSFLGDDDNAVYEVLATFVVDTRANLKELTEAVIGSDYAQVNQVAHRMLPMFRQLKVSSAVPDLERLETARPDLINQGKLRDSLQKITKGATALMREMDERLATSPDYNS